MPRLYQQQFCAFARPQVIAGRPRSMANIFQKTKESGIIATLCSLYNVRYMINSPDGCAASNATFAKTSKMLHFVASHDMLSGVTTEGGPYDAAIAPHSGHRPGVARRSYPQFGQAWGARRRLAFRRIHPVGSNAASATHGQMGMTSRVIAIQRVPLRSRMYMRGL